MSTTINPNKALWEKGDFTRIAESMRESGEALVTALGITDGLEVLDLGSGDGTTALPAAKLGANSSASTSPATSSRLGTHEHRASASPTADSKKATRPT
jgi:cyclopropane fatty-acyl-phospholipid synthase-like methyltransferase